MIFVYAHMGEITTSKAKGTEVIGTEKRTVYFVVLNKMLTVHVFLFSYCSLDPIELW